MKNLKTTFHATLAALCILLVMPVSVAAQGQQTATQLLQQASRAYTEAKGVKAGFSIQAIDADGQEYGQMEGSILLKNDKFKLTVPDELIVWFDGQNQWMYLPQMEEVNLSNPSEEELLLINPVNVFMLYRHGFDCQAKGERKYRGKSVQVVEMRPQDKGMDMDNILVYFDRQTFQPRYVQFTNRDRSRSIIQITEYQPGQDYPDTLFVFPQKDYPTATVIDLR